MYPLVSLHPKAYEKSKAIVCAKSMKMLEDVYAKKAIPKPTCETDAVDETIKLAQSLGINGTPAIVLPNGSLISGMRDAATIIKLIIH